MQRLDTNLFDKVEIEIRQIRKLIKRIDKRITQTNLSNKIIV